MSSKPAKRYTVGEEVFNSVSHGVGALLSVVGATVITTLAVCFGSTTAIFTSIIYGASLIVLYTMSTLYHAFPFENVKNIFRIFDHASIFILIAGSYTPMCLIALQGSQKAFIVICVVWACAIAGIIMNAINLEKTEKIGLVLYVVMGWSSIIVIKDIAAVLSGPAFWLLVGGGISYTGGIIFYKMTKVKYMHSVWHLFVLLGSILHYICVVAYVLPLAY